MAKSIVVSDLFVRRNTQSFLGFIIESQGSTGREVRMLFPGGAPAGKTLVTMRAGYDHGALSGLPVVASDGPMVVQVVERPGPLAVGYHVSCPFSRTSYRRYAGFIIPKIPKVPGQDSKNTLGQYGVLMQTRKKEFSPMAFFVNDIGYHFANLYEGVRFGSRDPVYVHVCVYNQSEWHRFVSQPIPPPPFAMFHRNPYTVLVGNLLFMMYLLDIIVCFDLEIHSFEVVYLPVEVSATATSWFDYTVTKGTDGGLPLVHFSQGVVTRWILDAQTDVVNWRLESSFNIAEELGGMLNNPLHEILIDVVVDWRSVQLRCASQDARFILITVGLNAGMFIVDMLEKTVQEMPSVVANGKLGRVFQLGENWPPLK